MGRPDQRGVRQLSRGPTRWRAPIVAGRPVQPRPMRWGARISCESPAQPRVYAVAGPESATSDFPESFGQVMASTPPGRSEQPRDTWWALQGTATRRSASSTAGQRGPVAGRTVCVKPSSSLAKRASPLLWSVGAAAGYAVDLPGNGPRAGPPAPPWGYAGQSECAGPSVPQALRVVRPSDGLDSFVWSAQLPDAVGYPGTLNAGPPVQQRAYAAAASSTEWPAPLHCDCKLCGVTRIVIG